MKAGYTKKTWGASRPLPTFIEAFDWPVYNLEKLALKKKIMKINKDLLSRISPRNKLNLKKKNKNGDEKNIMKFWKIAVVFLVLDCTSPV